METTAFLLRNQAMFGNCTLLLHTERGKKLCCYCSGLFKNGETTTKDQTRRGMHQGHTTKHSHKFTLSEHFFLLKNKQNSWRDGKGNMHMERASILYFRRWAGKKGGGSSGTAREGKMTAAGSPAQTGRLCGTKRISSTLCHFSAKVQPQELPEQPKLRDEDTSRERLIRHFPVTTGRHRLPALLSPPTRRKTARARLHTPLWHRSNNVPNASTNTVPSASFRSLHTVHCPRVVASEVQFFFPSLSSAPSIDFCSRNFC